MISDDYVTAGQAAEVLHVTRQTIYRWCKNGLASEHIGRQCLIAKADLVERIENKIRILNKDLTILRQSMKKGDLCPSK